MVRRIFVLLALVLFYSNPAVSGLFSNKRTDYLPVEQAFQLSAERNEKIVQFNWYIAEGYYLYQKELKITENGKILPLKILSNSQEHQDPYFGKTEIFTQQLQLQVVPTNLSPNSILEVSYQGCTEGLCYPPQTDVIKITDLPQISNKTQSSNEQNNFQDRFTTEQQNLAYKLFQHKYAILWFFLLGLGLAFTPCVLPMLPLLSAIVIGRQIRPNSWRALSLSFVYVQGMALTYTILGLVVATVGLPLQIALQSPYVLVSLAILFVILSLSMFGVFTLQLPTRLQTKLTLLSQKQQSGAYGGVFLMGMIAGLVASPCTSAPLSGVLLYVAQSGNLLIGAITLYLLALGMGTPLILVTLFGNKILPKSGVWLNNVKISFGFVMLAVPIFLLSRILPFEWEALLWSGLAVAFFSWVTLKVCRDKWWLQIIGLILIIMSSKPLLDWFWQPQPNQVISHLQFEKINNYDQLQRTLTHNSKPYAMVDFYADWCVACKEFEKYTFSDPKVQLALTDFKVIQIDMTKNSLANKEISEKLKILGLPTILFFDRDGKEIPNSRITGFLDAKEFLQKLKQLQ
ncbi:protein-disulfide reductase DsbD [Mergibacter septicus]|uniref:Thiol:disulfide interchange protein DsbD n=1 Tax=Mergibacter septicus TaxID=221402 RepID=A0A8E3MEW5_9PAST|nr:protein-disulfide reductase DsbD [Mergibacter septicus]AWX14782.1 protein-disulfide reductase DsbD [Mergibacter septicus]QDJ14033.1 protein-disulfide reductase DsbD [Mergibacter septicus]UTU48519.1 protein-disulfide reductase DsbD [Mergibacter septicus]WMR95851.1 protein-disulfide reductase DsbD [Mergibacter septicus]